MSDRPMDQHPNAGFQLDVPQACPDCPLGQPRVFCPTCLGAGKISNSRLARWQFEKWQEANPIA